MRVIKGERIGEEGTILLGCTAFILDPTRHKVLLIRRADNGKWALPGGRWEPGESVAEACEREVWEETGLRVRVKNLIGVYSNPNQLLEYPDGNRYHNVALNFTVHLVGGELAPSNETTENGYFTQAEIQKIDLIENHRERIRDGFEFSCSTYIR